MRFDEWFVNKVSVYFGRFIRGINGMVSVSVIICMVRIMVSVLCVCM